MAYIIISANQGFVSLFLFNVRIPYTTEFLPISKWPLHIVLIHIFVKLRELVHTFNFISFTHPYLNCIWICQIWGELHDGVIYWGNSNLKTTWNCSKCWVGAPGHVHWLAGYMPLPHLLTLLTWAFALFLQPGEHISKAIEPVSTLSKLTNDSKPPTLVEVHSTAHHIW